MAQKKNLGFDPAEIEQLKKECIEAGQKFVYFEDELNDEPDNVEEFVHVQFVGEYKNQEVIYDAVLYTLRLHYNSVVYETAERKAIKSYPLYVPMENRDETYTPNEAMDEEVELFITELIEEIEENEEIKLAEHIEVDENFEYGIGLDVCLNVEEITEKVVIKFVDDFLSGSIRLDPTLYSFKTEHDD
ncbi:hypothetical protein [Flectobacillus major]|jgi:hypothetical protein|uniref:hypothetical protein n=1 Tax=Flectobacillus major TaxID=103 RepID=UPI0003FDB062|nr:hypothetical protein [Flectobacillus major]